MYERISSRAGRVCEKDGSKFEIFHLWKLLSGTLVKCLSVNEN